MSQRKVPDRLLPSLDGSELLNPDFWEAFRFSVPLDLFPFGMA